MNATKMRASVALTTGKSKQRKFKYRLSTGNQTYPIPGISGLAPKKCWNSMARVTTVANASVLLRTLSSHTTLGVSVVGRKKKKPKKKQKTNQGAICDNSGPVLTLKLDDGPALVSFMDEDELVKFYQIQVGPETLVVCYAANGKQTWLDEKTYRSMGKYFEVHDMADRA